MKFGILVTICTFLWIPQSFSQKVMAFLDSTERSFGRARGLVTALSCDLEFDRKVDEFCIPYYINDRGTRVDVSFFNAFSLPFFNEFQTEFGTTQAYTNWIKFTNAEVSKSELSILQENKDSSFVIIQFCENEIKKLRIVSRKKKIFYCISIISTELPHEKQIWYLKHYLKTNKLFHEE